MISKFSAMTAAAAIAFASSAAAAPSLSTEAGAGGGCASDLSFVPGVSTLELCYGRYNYNVMTGSNVSELNAALDKLGYTGPDFTGANFDNFSDTKLNFLGNGNTPIDFPGIFNGTLFFGLKTGNANGGGGVGAGTTFYRINAINLDVFTFLPSGASSGGFVITQTAVPEPTTWAMLILGFGLLGGALRGARKNRPALNYI